MTATQPALASLKQAILVVEDHDDIRRFFTELLEKAGYQILVAGDGVEAVEILSRGDILPAVILLDIHMPRMNGFRVYSILRRDPKLSQIPVLLSSSDPYAEDIAAALGVAGYLPKCPPPAVMLSAITGVLNDTRVGHGNEC